MTAYLLAGGLAAAVTLLALVGRTLRRGQARIASPEAVAQAAERDLAGFDTANAVVGADGAGALAVATDGRVAAARRAGARIAVCEVPWTAVRATAAGIVVETGERRVGRVLLAGVDVLDIRRLAPRPASSSTGA